DEQGVKLSELLRRHGVERLFVGGLATDYCIKFTVLDGIKEGFKVVLLKDAIKGVNLEFGDAERAIAEMTNAGAETKESSQISSI
ncbi:MAG: isochorismatase family protein, partial [Candidatus Binatia bacterium]|nr:isochorismatase family protein [Candidatus Binatia bacterium]